MIRLAKLSDIPELHRMGERFFVVSGYSDIAMYNYKTMDIMFESLIESKSIYTDGKHGMLGFVVLPIFFDKNSMIAQELFWWVDEEKRDSAIGSLLLASAERQSKKLGAKALAMLSIEQLGGDILHKVYTHRGYVKRETSYIKEL